MFPDSLLWFDCESTGCELQAFVENTNSFFRELTKSDWTVLKSSDNRSVVPMKIRNRGVIPTFRITKAAIEKEFEKGKFCFDRRNTRVLNYQANFFLKRGRLESGLLLIVNNDSADRMDRISFLPSTILGEKYTLPLPEAKFLELVKQVVRHYQPVKGVFSFFDLGEKLGYDNTNPEIAVGLVTYICGHSPSKKKLPANIAQVDLDEGRLYYIPRKVLDLPKKEVERVVKSLGKYLYG